MGATIESTVLIISVVTFRALLEFSNTQKAVHPGKTIVMLVCHEKTLEQTVMLGKVKGSGKKRKMEYEMHWLKKGCYDLEFARLEWRSSFGCHQYVWLK